MSKEEPTCKQESNGNLNMKVHSFDSDGDEITLDKLPIGDTATIIKILPNARGRKKFADVGLVPGTDLLMEGHAPFGGLLRIKIMETSIALHCGDAAGIVMKKHEKEVL